jgi:hypothetical protein
VKSPTLFALLDADWAALAPTPTPRRWRDDPALAAHATLAELVAVTERRADPAASDRVLAALARRAAPEPGPMRATPDRPAEPDDLAARTLLQMLLPGAKALARRLVWLGDPTERAAAVTACLYEQIRTYPWRRRPARVAANLLGDTRQRLLQAAGSGSAPVAGGGRVAELSLEELAEQGGLPEPALATPLAGAPEPSPAEELLALLTWAVDDGHLTGAQARLIGQSRIADVPCEELGAAAGLCAHSLRRRRQRAEHALRHAARATAGGPEFFFHLARRVPGASGA